jgi:hypothetical protein
MKRRSTPRFNMLDIGNRQLCQGKRHPEKDLDFSGDVQTKSRVRVHFRADPTAALLDGERALAENSRCRRMRGGWRRARHLPEGLGRQEGREEPADDAGIPRSGIERPPVSGRARQTEFHQPAHKLARRRNPTTRPGPRILRGAGRPRQSGWRKRKSFAASPGRGWAPESGPAASRSPAWSSGGRGPDRGEPGPGADGRSSCRESAGRADTRPGQTPSPPRPRAPVPGRTPPTRSG